MIMAARAPSSMRRRAYSALAYSTAQRRLRTGLTHFFKRRDEADRSAAHDVWQRTGSGELATPTPGLAPGFVQANMVAVQKEHGYDFLMFCLRNPQPCPLLDVSDPGEPHATLAGPGADLRSCIPRYKVWRHGECEREATSVEDVYAEAGDMVTFLLGCSFSWENKLTDVGLQPRHIEQARNVPMYRTDPNVPTLPTHPPAPSAARWW